MQKKTVIKNIFDGVNVISNDSDLVRFLVNGNTPIANKLHDIHRYDINIAKSATAFMEKLCRNDYVVIVIKETNIGGVVDSFVFYDDNRDNIIKMLDKAFVHRSIYAIPGQKFLKNIIKKYSSDREFKISVNTLEDISSEGSLHDWAMKELGIEKDPYLNY